MSVDAVAGVLVLGGVDVVDGSPVLDIKPYVPFSDAVEGAHAPDWVTVRDHQAQGLWADWEKVGDWAGDGVQEQSSSITLVKCVFASLLHVRCNIGDVHPAGI